MGGTAKDLRGGLMLLGLAKRVERSERAAASLEHPEALPSQPQATRPIEIQA